MKLRLRIPTCNIIACEDIASSGDAKTYICNPFTAVSKNQIKKFYTYSVIQDIPNGALSFKIQIIDPSDRLLKETEDGKVTVEENVVMVKTKWTNISFSESGRHIFKVLIKVNNEYEMVGSSQVLVM